MKEIRVKAASHTYPVMIGKGLRHSLDTIIRHPYEQIIIVTDSNVKNIYLDDCIATLDKKFRILTYTIPSGEASKSFAMYEKLQKFLLNHHVSRNSAILALGGGVVGDLAGFVAATYARGIGFIQMPTTLLAHDSSIGGKVAINLSGKKNIIGSFYPPHQVIVDLEFFKTLNKQEKRSGLAEVIKHGLIDDTKLYEQLLSEVHPEIDYTSEVFEKVLVCSIQVKQDIIERDEKEDGIRAYLNFGHTFGHALEALETKTQRTHGECVMVGMFFSLWVSKQQNQMISSSLVENLLDWVNRFGYPLELPQNTTEEIFRNMTHDKKNVGNQIQMVLLKNPGEPYLQAFDPQFMIELIGSFITLWNQGEFIEQF